MLKSHEIAQIEHKKPMWSCIVQNNDHIFILMFELIIDFDNLIFKYGSFYPFCNIKVPLTTRKHVSSSFTHFMKSIH